MRGNDAKTGPFLSPFATGKAKRDSDLPASSICWVLFPVSRPSDDLFFFLLLYCVDFPFHVPQSIWSSSQNEYLYHRQGLSVHSRGYQFHEKAVCASDALTFFFFTLRASDKLTPIAFFFLPADIQRRWRIGASITLAVRSFSIYQMVSGISELIRGDSAFGGAV